jgi:hypothetical protein
MKDGNFHIDMAQYAELFGFATQRIYEDFDTYHRSVFVKDEIRLEVKTENHEESPIELTYLKNGVIYDEDNLAGMDQFAEYMRCTF